MKKKEEKKTNKNENSNNQNFGNNHTQNLTSCSCYNAINNENLLLFNKEIINKKNLFKKDSFISTDNESDTPKNKAENNQNFLPPNNCLDNSAFKQNSIKSIPSFQSINSYNSYNYYLNCNQPCNFNIISNNFNFFPPVYANPYDNPNPNVSDNKIIPFYKIMKEPHNNLNLLNKKRSREIKNILIPKKVKIKTVLNLNDKNEIKKEKKNLFEISIKNDKKVINFFKIKKNREKIMCKHSGCDLLFKTKKQAIFHHFKMSPKCQDDTISLLKMIFETKKIVVKSMEKNENNYEEISKLYENTMKEISLSDYINIITGLKIKDKI